MIPTVAEQLAWAAGLFEGEGWFTHQKNGGPVAAISMTDRDVVERFRDVVGWGNVYSVNKGPGNKRQWRCTIGGYERVGRFVQLVGPWLGERRRAQAERVLMGEVVKRIEVARNQMRLLVEEG